MRNLPDGPSYCHLMERAQGARTPALAIYLHEVVAGPRLRRYGLLLQNHTQPA